MYVTIKILLIFTFLITFCYNENVDTGKTIFFDLNTVTPIKLAAVGRVAKFGELYDARTDQFLRLSLFKSQLTNVSITLTQNRETKLKYTKLDTYEEKFSALDISAELKLSILVDLFQLEGSGRYFKNTKKSARTDQASLINSFSTSFEEISITESSIKSLVDFDILEQIDATHVVVGIQWGGNVFISVEDTSSNNKDNENTEGRMGVQMKKIAGLIGVSGSGNVNISQSEMNEMNKFSFEVFGDILPDDTPQTFIDAIKFMKSAPSLLQKSNNGKGKAMKYNLIPISILRKLWKMNTVVNYVVKRIDEATVKSCVKLFDNMNKIEQKINDLVTDVEKMEDYLDKNKINEVKNIQHNYGIYQSEVQKNLSEHLILVRSGNETVDKLQYVILQSSKHPYAWDKIDFEKFGELVQEISFIESLKKINVTVLNKKTIMQSFLYDNYNNDLYIYFYNNGYNKLKSEDRAMTTFWSMIENKQEYGPKALFAAIKYENLEKNYRFDNSTSKQKVTLFRKSKVEIDDYVIGSKPENATNPELWSLYHMQHLLASIIEKLDKLSFIYTQLPYSFPPYEIWPGMEWKDISQVYAGLFFRVIGNYSESFETVQEPNDRYIDEIQTDFTHYDKNHVYANYEQGGEFYHKYVDMGGSSSDKVSTLFHVGYGYLSKGINKEIRPRNTAVKIWKRTG